MSEIKLNIDEMAGQTKIQQLVHSITEAISNGKLKAGDVLPSVNRFSGESGFSRDTVFKAYNLLKKQGTIESAPQKGYFVASDSPRVFMLLDDFSAFKEQLYNAFRDNLPASYSVDLWFHHYNQANFEQLIQNSQGRYSMYVVMNIDNKGIDPGLKKIDPKKLLLLDMGKPGKTDNYLLQDFDKAVEACLAEGWPALQRYNEFILIYSPTKTPHPADTVTAFSRICKLRKMKYRVTEKFSADEMKQGQAYLAIKDSDLVEVIKTASSKGLNIGSEIGIISYNDTPMKEIVHGGITVISTDFRKMGAMAAEFVKTRQPLAEVLPTRLIIRQSL
jgi:DNA-binding transcriptional regulator YhcF (GntR family)